MKDWFYRAEFPAFHSEGIIPQAQRGWRTAALRTVNLSVQPGPLGWWANAISFLYVLWGWSFAHATPHLSHPPYFPPPVSYPSPPLCSSFLTFSFHNPVFQPFMPFPPYLHSLQPLLCIAVTRKWEKHSITVFMESLMAGWDCALLPTAKSVPSSKSSAVCPS